MTNGEKLNNDSLLVPTKCKNTTVRQRAKAVSRRLTTVFKKVEYGSRPYSLKNFFATALLNSSVEQNLQTFYMGHTGAVQNVYSVNRQQPPEQIEKMRIVFKEKIEPNLVPQEGNADASVRKGFRKLAESLGIEVKEDADTDETIAEIAEIYKAGKDDVSRREISPNPIKQKRITEEEIDDYLEDDWEITHTLSNGNLIVKKIMIS